MVRIDRGMLSETIDYDFEGAGQVKVTCKRQAIIFGQYSCEAVHTK
jgi:hypothetical protein